MILECPNCQTRYETSALLPPEGRKVRCARCSHVWHALPVPEEPEQPVEDETMDDGIPAINPNADANQDLEFRDTPEGWDKDWGETQEQTASDEEISEADMSWGGSEQQLASEPEQQPEPDLNMQDDFAGKNDDFAQSEPQQAPMQKVQKAQNPVEVPFKSSDEAGKIEIDPSYHKKKKMAALAAMFQKQSGMQKVIAGWLALVIAVITVFSSAYIFRKQVVSLMPGAVHVYAALGITVNVRGLEFQQVVTNNSNEAGRPVIQVSGKIVNSTNESLPIPTIVFAFRDKESAELYHWTKRLDLKTLDSGQAIDFQFYFPPPPQEAHTIMVRFAKKTAEF